MLKELYEAIARDGALRESPRIIKASAEPGHVYYLFEPVTGTLKRMESEPALRTHELDRLDAVLAVVGPTDVPLHLDRDAVRAYSERHVQWRLDVTTTAEYTTMHNLSTKRYHKAFVRELHRAAHLALDMSALIAFQKIRCTKKEDGQYDYQIGSGQSVSKSLLSQVHGESGVLPQSITFNVPVYNELIGVDGIDPNHDVVLNLEVDTDEGLFSLVSPVGQFEEVHRNMLSRVEAWLNEKLPEHKVIRGAKTEVDKDAD